MNPDELELLVTRVIERGRLVTPDALESLATRVAELLEPMVLRAVTEQASKPPRLSWSVAEVAERVGVDKATAYRWVDRGELPASRLGGRLVVLDSDLVAFVEAGKVYGALNSH